MHALFLKWGMWDAIDNTLSHSLSLTVTPQHRSLSLEKNRLNSSEGGWLLRGVRKMSNTEPRCGKKEFVGRFLHTEILQWYSFLYTLPRDYFSKQEWSLSAHCETGEMERSQLGRSTIYACIWRRSYLFTLTGVLLNSFGPSWELGKSLQRKWHWDVKHGALKRCMWYFKHFWFGFFVSLFVWIPQ